MKLFNLLFLTIIVTIISVVHSGVVQLTKTQINWVGSQIIFQTNTVLIIDQETLKLKRSKDSGETWNDVTIGNTGPKVYGNDIFQQKNFGNNIMVSNNSVQFSVSRDGGSTWSQSPKLSYRVKGISAHPKIDGLLIGQSSGKYVMTSNDFGLTWVNRSNGYVIHNGNEPLWNPLSDIKTPTFYSILNLYGGTSDRDGVFCHSSDMGVTQLPLLQMAVDMASTENYYYVGAYEEELSDKPALYVKSLLNQADIGIDDVHDGFLECEFPFGSDEPNIFTILDDSSSSIFMGVMKSSTTGGLARYGTIYSSNAAGNIFTMVEKDVALNNGLYDFIPLSGTVGSYMINRVTNYKALNKPTTPALLASYISYDNGGRWSRFTPPTGTVCQNKGCKLNMNGLNGFISQSTGYGPLYSVKGIPGLILATGNINTAISTATLPNEIKTFFSSDNGRNWKVFSEQGTIYEYGSYGSSIMFASAMTDTDTVSYTFDQGNTIVNISLGGIYDVMNIVVDPNFSNSAFILMVQDKLNIDYLISVNLEPVLPSVCSENQKNIVSSEQCILGKHITYTTVKQGANCYFADQPQTNAMKACQCTYDDFECDIGYELDDSSSSDSGSSSDGSNTFIEPPFKCKISKTSAYTPMTMENCPMGETFLLSKGYRMVAGSACIDGLTAALSPAYVVCNNGYVPQDSSSSKHNDTSSTTTPDKKSSKGWVVAVIFIMLFGSIGAFAFILYKKPELRNKLQSFATDKLNSIKSGGRGSSSSSSGDTKYSVVGIVPNSLNDEDEEDQFNNNNEFSNNFNDEF